MIIRITQKNPIKNEKIFVQEEIKVWSVQNSVRVAFFCPLAKNFSLFI